ncbi:MAG: hypothetical protein IT428_10185 [Planctomycetaceae bacterium]|nr:hypothetical protein [Planctomycetaceae bacterium]
MRKAEFVRKSFKWTAISLGVYIASYLIMASTQEMGVFRADGTPNVFYRIPGAKRVSGAVVEAFFSPLHWLDRYYLRQRWWHRGT